jgi:hypothetical protein
MFRETLEMETVVTILATMQLSTAIVGLGVTLLVVSELLLTRSTNVPGRRSAFSTWE